MVRDSSLPTKTPPLPPTTIKPIFLGDIAEFLGQSGGAVTVVQGGLTIHTSTFTRNYAALRAGAVFSVDSDPRFGLKIRNSSFTSNFAEYAGGAVSILSSHYEMSKMAKKEYERSTNEEGDAKKAKQFGRKRKSALSAEESVNMNSCANALRAVTFEENEAQYGGALEFTISNKCSNVTNSMINATFTYNRASISGGAIYSASSPYVYFRYRELEFNSNSATKSGGTFFYNWAFSAVARRPPESQFGIDFCRPEDCKATPSHLHKPAWGEIMASSGLSGEFYFAPPESVFYRSDLDPIGEIISFSSNKTSKDHHPDDAERREKMNRLSSGSDNAQMTSDNAKPTLYALPITLFAELRDLYKQKPATSAVYASVVLKCVDPEYSESTPTKPKKKCPYSTLVSAGTTDSLHFEIIANTSLARPFEPYNPLTSPSEMLKKLNIALYFSIVLANAGTSAFMNPAFSLPAVLSGCPIGSGLVKSVDNRYASCSPCAISTYNTAGGGHCYSCGSSLKTNGILGEIKLQKGEINLKIRQISNFNNSRPGDEANVVLSKSTATREGGETRRTGGDEGEELIGIMCEGRTVSFTFGHWAAVVNGSNELYHTQCFPGHCLRGVCAPHRTGIACASCEKNSFESLFSGCSPTLCASPSIGLAVVVALSLIALPLTLHVMLKYAAAETVFSVTIVQLSFSLLAPSLDWTIPRRLPFLAHFLCGYRMTTIERYFVLAFVPYISIPVLWACYALVFFISMFSKSSRLREAKLSGGLLHWKRVIATTNSILYFLVFSTLSQSIDWFSCRKSPITGESWTFSPSISCSDPIFRQKRNRFLGLAMSLIAFPLVATTITMSLKLFYWFKTRSLIVKGPEERKQFFGFFSPIAGFLFEVTECLFAYQFEWWSAVDLGLLRLALPILLHSIGHFSVSRSLASFVLITLVMAISSRCSPFWNWACHIAAIFVLTVEAVSAALYQVLVGQETLSIVVFSVHCVAILALMVIFALSRSKNATPMNLSEWESNLQPDESEQPLLTSKRPGSSRMDDLAFYSSASECESTIHTERDEE